MSIFLKNIIRFAFFILIQVYILHHITPLHRFITPYLYFLYILWLPFNMSRFSLMVIAFGLGLTLDYFLNSHGLHAAPCVLIAYVRPFLINLLISQEGAEQNYASPSIVSMGWAPYATYAFVLTLLHHGYMIFLEWMQFGGLLYFFGRVIATTGISLLLILIAELLVFRKEKFRTNTA